MSTIIDTLRDYLVKETIKTPPPYPNILNSYTSYNYIFTLSCLAPSQVNDPNGTYKKGDLGQIIFKSGSGDPEHRVALPGLGAFDFYIEDVHIHSLIGFNSASGNTNATKISFKVIEPYSMGLFFHTLQMAAKARGHSNYIVAPYLLTLEFMGHLNPTEQGIAGDAISPIEKTTRHFPIRFMYMDMNVNGSGATYDMECIPWNEIAALKTYTNLKSDFTITGSTVLEILQTGEHSLQNVLNRQYKEAAARDGKKADIALILFPKDPRSGQEQSKEESKGAVDDSTKPKNTKSLLDVLHVIENKQNNDLTTYIEDEGDINPVIAKESMSFSSYQGGNTPFPKDSFVYDAEKHIYTRGNITIKEGEQSLKFAQSENVLNVINQVMIMSTYGQKQLKQEQIKDQKGKFLWWKIDLQSYMLSDDDTSKKTGEAPNVVVYRVIPYMVDASVFLPSGKANPYIKEDKKKAVKWYDYIYTGINVDILSFDINFKMSMIMATHANSISNSGDQKLAPNSSPKVEEKKQDEEKSLIEKIFNFDELVDSVDAQKHRVKSILTESSTYNQGGARLSNKGAEEIRQAHDLILNGVDMLTPNIKIVGDPYYIADSGMGNYTATATNQENLNADHSINYQHGEVDILVNFRTPLDIDPVTGTYRFGDDTTVLEAFSGLYRVIECENVFSKGQFTQELKLLRRPGQNPDNTQGDDQGKATT